MSFVEDDHLGGYIPGGDPATYYPELWTWLAEDFGVGSVLDVGAGDGVAVKFFREVIDSVYRSHPEIMATVAPMVFGVEGIPQKNQGIIRHDYTTGPYDFKNHLAWYFDLVWCCEFVEHVEERYVNNFLDSFTRGRTVLMTHAEPGQNGYHHVNCQPANYWIDKLRGIGYSLDIPLTMKTRQLAACNTSEWNHYVRSGMAFRRD